MPVITGERKIDLLSAIIRLQSMQVNALRTVVGEDTTLARRGLTAQELRRRTDDMRTLENYLTEMLGADEFTQGVIFEHTILRIYGRNGRGIACEYSAPFVRRYVSPIFIGRKF